MAQTYNVTQAAKILNVSVRTMQRWDREKKLVSYRTESNRRFYTKEQLSNFLHIDENELELTGNEVYTLLQEIANTDDTTLKEKFGTYELDDIIRNNSLPKLLKLWKK